jgi:hypothetical protein
MKTNKPFRTLVRAMAALLAAVVIGGLTAPLLADDTKPAEQNKKPADAKPAAATPEKKETPKVKLTGAQLYAINCNRCHPERYPTEFNSAQWKTLMLHMRVRANLPARDAKKVLKYLQEECGN